MVIDILIMEDDKLFCESLEDFLEESGYSVSIANDGQRALELCYEREFDLLLLDINVPYINGFELLQSIRASQDDTPAIFITSYKDKESLKRGYLSGGDDFMSKPIDLDELQLRIKAVLKRVKGIEKKIIINNLSYDPANAKIGDHQLSNKSKKLLDLLIEKRGEIVSKELILQRVWEWDEMASEASLRVYINQLKKILGKDSITNFKSIGYRLEL